ncbi:hypothetical protein V8C26DRAFT_414972 [Trichoderma gracile]
MGWWPMPFRVKTSWKLTVAASILTRTQPSGILGMGTWPTLRPERGFSTSPFAAYTASMVFVSDAMLSQPRFARIYSWMAN